jgi:hypothetical protein
VVVVGLSLALGPASALLGEKPLGCFSFRSAERRDEMRWRWSGEVLGERTDVDAEAEAGRAVAAAEAPGRWREILDALREGGPWKRDGGGRRAEAACLVDSAFGGGLGFRVGETGETGEVGVCLRSNGLPRDKVGDERGGNAMLKGLGLNAGWTRGREMC